MEISKGLQLEIQSVQSKLKNAIRDHQICVGKLKDDPNNADILDRIQEIQVHIVSLGRCQKQVVQRLRKEVDDYKAVNANEVKVSVAALLGLNNNNHITANNERTTNDEITDVRVVTNGLDNVRLANAKEDYEDNVRNGEILSSRDGALNKERSISVETLSADDEEIIEVTVDEDSRKIKRQMSEEPLDERKIKCTEQLSFLEVLGLITTLRSTELQNRRAERKRRTTANPQFVYSNWEMPTKRKRHNYLQSAGNVPQTRQTTARLNGPSPPPISNKSSNSIVPPKSTSPPTRALSKSLIPTQKASIRPNILRNMSESRVFPNKSNKIENENGQLQLSCSTTKTSQSSNSKAVHIPGLPSGLTIERIENDSAVCINCRNPGTLINCDNCEANYHVSCHSMSPPPPRLCPKCAVKMMEGTGIIKKNDELAAASYAPGVAGKAGEDPEIDKASGGFYKIGKNAKQQREIVAGCRGVDKLSGTTTFLIPITPSIIAGNNVKSDSLVATFDKSKLIIVESNGKDSITGTITNTGSSSSYSASIVVNNQYSRSCVTNVPQSNIITRALPIVKDVYVEKIIEKSGNPSDVESFNEKPITVEYHRKGRITGNDVTGNVESSDSIDSTRLPITGSHAETITRKKSTIRAIPGLTRIVRNRNNERSIVSEHINNDNMDELQSLGSRHVRDKFDEQESQKFMFSMRTGEINDRNGKYDKTEISREFGKNEQQQQQQQQTTESLFSRDKYRRKSGSIFNSLFTGYNKSDNVVLCNDNTRESSSSTGNDKIVGNENEHIDERNNDVSGCREIVSSGEHVKLEEAHLSAPSRAKLMRIIDDNEISINRDDDSSRMFYRANALSLGRRRTTEDRPASIKIVKRGSYDSDKNEAKLLPRILMKTERRSLESRDSASNYENFQFNDLTTYDSNLVKFAENTMKEKIESNSDTSATEDANSPISFEENNSLDIENRKSKLAVSTSEKIVENVDDDCELEIDEETNDNVEDIDDEEDQDCPIVDDYARQGANLGVRIGTVSPESMKVLELFENAMMQVENSDKTANP